MKLLVATTNPGKVREIAGILQGLPIELVTLDDYPQIPEPEETGETFAANADLKALYYAAATGVASVADDSGLEIDALDKQPGVHSARWFGFWTMWPSTVGASFMRRTCGLLHIWLRCVTIEDEIARLGDLVAGKAGIVHRRVGRLAVVELSETPAAGRGVSC